MKRKSAKIWIYSLSVMLAAVPMHVNAAGLGNAFPNTGISSMLSHDSIYSSVQAESNGTWADKTADAAENVAADPETVTKEEITQTLASNVTEEDGQAVEEQQPKTLPTIVKPMAAAEKKTAESEEESGTEIARARNLAIAQVHNYVNVRKEPDENSEILGKLYNNSVGDLLEVRDGWCKISSGSVEGYVKEEYCVTGMEANVLAKQVGTRLATVTADGLFVRKNASTDSAILGMAAYQDELVVLLEGEGWIKVDAEDGEGWVSSDYVTLRTEYVYAESREEEKLRLEKEEAERKKALAAAKKAKKQESQQAAAAPAPAEYSSFVLDPSTASVVGNSEMGNAVAEYALQFVGNPYVYGGSSLTSGTDCSGFVMSVYENFGVDLPHSSSADRKQGAKVDGIENAQAGDIVCYSGHVAIYIGDGKIVHAANQKNGIVVSPADYKRILAVRRIF